MTITAEAEDGWVQVRWRCRLQRSGAVPSMHTSLGPITSQLLTPAATTNQVSLPDGSGSGLVPRNHLVDHGAPGRIQPYWPVTHPNPHPHPNPNQGEPDPQSQPQR